ncbi:MAG: 16S rRNA (guanine(527)-N(7))-methyltransferase RsmG [Deltaproteobacteria bacterium]|nr:16S rRNA (guanine(527)-N(7))-methyltransferase RsmG [Candidatus Anaeroferrophillacea bacterium]
MNPVDFEDDLRAGARAIGVELPPGAAAPAWRFLEILRRWGKTYNLTTILNPRDMVPHHLLDSLIYLRGIVDRDAPVVDVGTGGGFPGLPLALALPATAFVLIESKQKKVLFLQHVVRELGLRNVDILHLHFTVGNAREVFPAPVRTLVSRAVSAAEVMLPLAAEVLEERGRLLLSVAAGSEHAAEITDLLAADKRLCRRETLTMDLPLTTRSRSLLVIGRR